MKFSNSKILSSQRGVSIISALVAVAIVGILIAMLATLQDNMAKAMLRSNMQRAADNLRRQVEGVLSQKDMCSRAIRGDAAGTSRITWQGPTYGRRPIPFILLSDGTTTTVLASQSTALNGSGKPYNQVVDGLFIDKIELRTRDINNDGVPDAAIETKVDLNRGGSTTSWFAVPAEISIVFRGPVDAGGNPVRGTEWIGGAFKAREIPVVLLMKNDGTYVIDRCDSPSAGNMASACQGTDPADAKQQALLDMGRTECIGHPCVWPKLREVGEIVYLKGFTATGEPLCECRTLCDAENLSWKDIGLQPVVGSPPCPAGSLGLLCPAVGDRCTAGPIGSGGKVRTHECQAN